MRIVFAAALLLFAAPARADCIEDGAEVALAGQAVPGFFGWTFVADRQECLVVLMDAPTRDGLARFEPLPGFWRDFALDWGGVAPVAGRVVVEGWAESLPEARSGAFAPGGGPAMVIRVRRAARD